MLRVTDENRLEIKIFLPLLKYDSFSVTDDQSEMQDS
jgi:hypothetical protein